MISQKTIKAHRTIKQYFYIDEKGRKSMRPLLFLSAKYCVQAIG